MMRGIYYTTTQYEYFHTGLVFGRTITCRAEPSDTNQGVQINHISHWLLTKNDTKSAKLMAFQKSMCAIAPIAPL